MTLFPGMATVKGTQDDFEVRIKRFGKEPVTLVGKGREYGDLGEGIVNSLIGDLESKVGEKHIARAEGSAGLERRLLVKT